MKSNLNKLSIRIIFQFNKGINMGKSRKVGLNKFVNVLIYFKICSKKDILTISAQSFIIYHEFLIKKIRSFEKKIRKITKRD